MSESESNDNFWPKLLVSILAFPYTVGRAKIPKDRKLGWGDVRFLLVLDIAFFCSVIIGGVAVFKGIPLVSDFLTHLSNVRNPRNSLIISIFGVVSILFIGWLLYEFKRWKQWLYGLVEVIVSCASGFYTFERLLTTNPSGLGIIVTIGTAIYFTQRGITNFIDGSPDVKAALEKAKNKIWRKYFTPADGLPRVDN